MKDTIIQGLLKLKATPKFDEDYAMFYPGMLDKVKKERLTQIINKSIDDFIILVQNDSDESGFHNGISKGLSYFELLDFNLDTEERERICNYMEQIMDVIGLESSGGILNKWMYGFEIN